MINWIGFVRERSWPIRGNVLIFLSRTERKNDTLRKADILAENRNGHSPNTAVERYKQYACCHLITVGEAKYIVMLGST
jgi:hypothetical protein